MFNPFELIHRLLGDEEFARQQRAFTVISDTAPASEETTEGRRDEPIYDPSRSVTGDAWRSNSPRPR